MGIGRIGEGIASFGQSLYRAFTSPIVHLFKALLGHPTVSEYGKIPSTVDHKLVTTYTELDRAIHARAWLSCFFNREAYLDRAATNVSLALMDLKQSLDLTATSPEAGQLLIDERIGYIMQAVTYTESQELTETQRNHIITGLTSLQSYQRYLTIWNRKAYQKATGLKDQVAEVPKDQLETLKEVAGNQGLRLQEIAKDIEQGSSDAPVLRDAAIEIKRNLTEDLLPQLEKLLSPEDYRSFVEYLQELNERIFPPTWLDQIFGWFGPTQVQEV